MLEKPRAIGISNMTVSKLQAVLPHLKVMPAAMEMEQIANADCNCRLIKGQVFLWEGSTDWQEL